MKKLQIRAPFFLIKLNFKRTYHLAIISKLMVLETVKGFSKIRKV